MEQTDDVKVFVEYKNKKNSSGRIIEGVIHLKISNLISKQEQQLHIERLKDKLTKKMRWAEQYCFKEAEGIVYTDGELKKLAQTINDAYYNYPLTEIAFHKQESTWGTCSRRTGKVYISERLIGAPLDLLWYVISHELCHLEEPSHDSRFWELVGKGCPNYIECRKKLKAYGYQ
ncbi:MAG: M48 family metallopeptidase [Clostridia bacterium]|jgi:predicted metal-dependent hydrolase|nr:M48 family metallopeptidase [Clostridia bacterium]